MKRKGKQSLDEVTYKLGGHAGIRLSKKSGATEDVVILFNSIHDSGGNISAEIIEALKLKIDIEKHYTKTQIDKLRNGGGFEAVDFVEKNSKSSKVSNVTEIKDINKAREIAKESKTPEVKKIEEIKKSSNLETDIGKVNEELENQVRSMPGLNAFKSIKRNRNT